MTIRWRRAWRALTADPRTPARYAAMAAAEAKMGREAAKRHRPRGEAADAAAWHADGVWAWEGLHLAVAGQRQALADHAATRPAWTGPGRALAAIADDGPTPDRLRALHSALMDAGAACEGVDPIADLADQQ